MEDLPAVQVRESAERIAINTSTPKTWSLERQEEVGGWS